jgi:hypothetical protein
MTHPIALADKSKAETGDAPQQCGACAGRPEAQGAPRRGAAPARLASRPPAARRQRRGGRPDLALGAAAQGFRGAADGGVRPVTAGGDAAPASAHRQGWHAEGRRPPAQAGCRGGPLHLASAWRRDRHPRLAAAVGGGGRDRRRLVSRRYRHAGGGTTRPRTSPPPRPPSSSGWTRWERPAAEGWVGQASGRVELRQGPPNPTLSPVGGRGLVPC